MGGFRLGEDQDVLVGHEVGRQASGPGLSGLGQLPERGPSHQLAPPHGAQQGDDVLAVAEADLAGEGHRGRGQVEAAPAAAQLLVTVTRRPPGRSTAWRALYTCASWAR